MVVGPKTPGAGKASRDEARPHSAVIDFVTVGGRKPARVPHTCRIGGLLWAKRRFE